MRGVIILAVIAATAAPAAADVDWESFTAHSWLKYEATYVAPTTAPKTGGDGTSDGLGLVGLRLGGFGGPGRVGLALGLDLAAGATRHGDFAYDVTLHFLGVGVALGDSSWVGVTAGLGASGATSDTDDAMTVPFEAWAEIGLGKYFRLLARGRASFLFDATNRLQGSPSTPFDELDGTVAIRLGNHYDEHGFPSGEGWYVGLAYREATGVSQLGGVIGYEAEVGTRARHEECCDEDQ